MKRWGLTILFATVAHFGTVACDNDISGGGSGGSAGNGTTSSSSSTSSSSTSSSSTSSSSTTSSSGGGMLGMGECRTSDDCVEMNGAFCMSPDAPQLCGACFEPPDPCLSDAECAQQDPTTICVQPPCSCGGSACAPGCMSDADCKDWQHCSPGHRCEADACASNADCPDNFACTSGECARKACTSDVDCNGFCVNSQCYDMAGHCTIPAP